MLHSGVGLMTTISSVNALFDNVVATRKMIVGSDEVYGTQEENHLYSERPHSSFARHVLSRSSSPLQHPSQSSPIDFVSERQTRSLSPKKSKTFKSTSTARQKLGKLMLGGASQTIHPDIPLHDRAPNQQISASLPRKPTSPASRSLLSNLGYTPASRQHSPLRNETRTRTPSPPRHRPSLPLVSPASYISEVSTPRELVESYKHIEDAQDLADQDEEDFDSDNDAAYDNRNDDVFDEQQSAGGDLELPEFHEHGLRTYPENLLQSPLSVPQKRSPKQEIPSSPPLGDREDKDKPWSSPFEDVTIEEKAEMLATYRQDEEKLQRFSAPLPDDSRVSGQYQTQDDYIREPLTYGGQNVRLFAQNGVAPFIDYRVKTRRSTSDAASQTESESNGSEYSLNVPSSWHRRHPKLASFTDKLVSQARGTPIIEKSRVKSASMGISREPRNTQSPAMDTRGRTFRVPSPGATTTSLFPTDLDLNQQQDQVVADYRYSDADLEYRPAFGQAFDSNIRSSATRDGTIKHPSLFQSTSEKLRSLPDLPQTNLRAEKEQMHDLLRNLSRSTTSSPSTSNNHREHQPGLTTDDKLPSARSPPSIATPHRSSQPNVKTPVGVGSWIDSPTPGRRTIAEESIEPQRPISDDKVIPFSGSPVEIGHRSPPSNITNDPNRVAKLKASAPNLPSALTEVLEFAQRKREAGMIDEDTLILTRSLAEEFADCIARDDELLNSADSPLRSSPAVEVKSAETRNGPIILQETKAGKLDQLRKNLVHIVQETDGFDRPLKDAEAEKQLVKEAKATLRKPVPHHQRQLSGPSKKAGPTSLSHKQDDVCVEEGGEFHDFLANCPRCSTGDTTLWTFSVPRLWVWPKQSHRPELTSTGLVLFLVAAYSIMETFAQSVYQPSEYAENMVGYGVNYNTPRAPCVTIQLLFRCFTAALLWSYQSALAPLAGYIGL